MFRSYTEVFRPNVKSQSRSNKVQWFSCDICDADEADLDSHWRSETDVELHRKEVHFKLICHQRKKYPDRFCTVCMTLQKNNASLIAHIKQRHLFTAPQARRVEREVFICDYCHHMFFNKEVLVAHIQYFHLWSLEHRWKKTFLCPKCKRICQLKSLWFHMQHHEIPSLSVCDICLAPSSNVRELMLHLKEHPPHYRCDTCDFHAGKARVLDAHLAVHEAAPHGPPPPRRALHEAFLKMRPHKPQLKYNIHHTMKGMLLPSVMHICILCREICTDKTEMSLHMSRDHSLPQPAPRAPLRCHCGDHFPSRVLLKHHVFKLKGHHREDTGSEPAGAECGVKSLRAVQVAALPAHNAPWLADYEMNEDAEDAEPSRALPGAAGAEPETAAGSDELVYIYATVDDEELVDSEQDSEEIIGL